MAGKYAYRFFIGGIWYFAIFTGRMVFAEQDVHKYLREGDKIAVERALKSGSQIFSRDNDNNSVLHFPVLQCNTELVKYLVAELKKTRKSLKKILNEAFPRICVSSDKSAQSLEIAALLLKHGADINALDNHVPLIVKAVKNHNRPLLRFLLDKKANLDIKNTWPPLLVAAKDYPVQSAEIIELLLKNGANPNVVDSDNLSALMFLCIDNKTTAAMILIRYKANVNIVNKHGFTALHYARGHENEQLVKALLANGAREIPAPRVWRPLNSSSVASNSNQGPVCLSYKADGSLICSGAPLDRVTCPGARNWHGQGDCTKLPKMKVTQLGSEWKDLKSSYESRREQSENPDSSGPDLNTCFANCMANCDKTYGTSSITKKDSYGRSACTSSCTQQCPAR